jgi:hypothetical protein
MDFAKNQKTITGLAIMLLPVIANVLGYEITAESTAQFVASLVEILGAGIALFGLVMKALRMVKNIFKK